MPKKIVITQLYFPELEALVPIHKGETIEECFANFHKANPHVLKHLTRIALWLKGIGFDRYSIKGIYERLRFAAIETTGVPYKMNNDYTPLYSRMIMEETPKLAGFFQTRVRESEEDAEIKAVIASI